MVINILSLSISKVNVYVMKTKFKLSVIVPAYNAEKIIKDCLNRILQETKKIVSEIIVVDDCSTDNTLAILKSFKKI